MLKYYSPGGITAHVKEDFSPVTKADIEINEMVISEVGENYPDYQVLAEESSNNNKQSKNLFVVDPLDGTHMFAIGSPLFVFLAAVVIDGESIAGVIYNPLAKRTLLAEKGKGAYLVEENKLVRVSAKKTFEGALINAGWKTSDLSELLYERGTRTPQIYSVGEIAAMIATGGFEGTAFSGTSAYDIAAPKIVIEEAGGKVTDLYGDEQRYDQNIKGAVLSNRYLHEELVKLVKEAGLKPTPYNK